MSRHSNQFEKKPVFTVEKNDQYQCVFPKPLDGLCEASFDTPAEAWTWIATIRYQTIGASTWAIEPKAECAKALWGALGDVPINEDEEIDVDWLIFEKGTPREEIWHWFEAEFDVSVASLMYPDSLSSEGEPSKAPGSTSKSPSP